MDKLRVDCCHSQKNIGLTLIEVLIALAIIGIAMMAVMKAASQSIRSTAYLETKSMALWVAQETGNEARFHLLSGLSTDDEARQKKEMLGREWYVNVKVMETPQPTIKKLLVSVFTSDEDDTPIITLEAYRDDQ